MRRTLVILAVLAALFVLAIPAMAQTGPADSGGVTIESLTTVVGASAVAAIVVAFAGTVVTLSARAKRVLSALVGLIVVVGVTLATADVTVPTFIMAVLTGMSAGLAASKGQELGSEGLNHQVTSRP